MNPISTYLKRRLYCFLIQIVLVVAKIVNTYYNEVVGIYLITLLTHKYMVLQFVYYHDQLAVKGATCSHTKEQLITMTSVISALNAGKRSSVVGCWIITSKLLTPESGRTSVKSAVQHLSTLSTLRSIAESTLVKNRICVR